MSEGFKTPPYSVSESPFIRVESILTPEQLRQRYLFGIDLTDDQGNTLGDEVLQHQINAAVSYLELKLDIIITETKFVERYDYRQADYSTFNFMQLKKRPIVDVDDLKAKFPSNRELVSYPKEWYVVEKEAGQLQLSPVEGSFSGLIVTQGGSYVPLIYSAQSYWPHLFEVTYRAGFECGKIPIVVNEMIGLQAAIRTFEILGDIILGSGTSSETTSLDAASTTKTLTASAMYSGFSARIESYQKQMKEYIKTVQDYYRGIPITII